MSNSIAVGVAYADPSFQSVAVTGTLSSTGNTSFGDAATDTFGFCGTVAVQSSAITAVGTSIPVAACASFGLTSTQLTAMITGLNAVIVALAAHGITAT